VAFTAEIAEKIKGLTTEYTGDHRERRELLKSSFLGDLCALGSEFFLR
jgi:hypothetical protein